MANEPVTVTKDLIPATDKGDPVLTRLQNEAMGAIDILHGDLTHADYKAHQAAAFGLLDRAGYGSKGASGGSVVVNINLAKVADGLRQVAEIGFGNGGK
jgi:hypothetical protein